MLRYASSPEFATEKAPLKPLYTTNASHGARKTRLLPMRYSANLPLASYMRSLYFILFMGNCLRFFSTVLQGQELHSRTQRSYPRRRTDLHRLPQRRRLCWASRSKRILFPKHSSSYFLIRIKTLASGQFQNFCRHIIIIQSTTALDFLNSIERISGRQWLCCQI